MGDHMNETKVALVQIKKRMLSINYPLMAATSFMTSILCTLDFLGTHPSELSKGFIPIFWFTIKMTSILPSLVMIGLVVGSFGETYEPKVRSSYKNYRSHLFAIFGIFRNAKTINNEHVNKKEWYKNLFDEMLRSEKPYMWKWFARIFLYIHQHFKDYDERFESLEKFAKETLEKKDEEIKSWKKKVLKLRRKLEEIRKKYHIDDTFESDLMDD